MSEYLSPDVRERMSQGVEQAGGNDTIECFAASHAALDEAAARLREAVVCVDATVAWMLNESELRDEPCACLNCTAARAYDKLIGGSE